MRIDYLLGEFRLQYNYRLREWTSATVTINKRNKENAAEGELAASVKDRQYVTALARGLAILRCFTRSTPLLGSAEIARMTGLPQPTVWRLCFTLIREGYLVQDSRADKLRPGIPVLSLGYAAIAGTPIAELARSEMQAIALRHQGAVSLGMRNGFDMVYLQRCQGSSIVLRDLDIGSRVPLATSVTGWAYMAGLSEVAREALFEELGKAESSRWPDLLSKIRKALANFVGTGYVINKGSLHAQINAVGVPILSDDGTVLLSLSSGGISQVFDDEKLQAIGEELKQLASRLRPVLGVR
jgi:DNA-binding IclR family transcriptional regulator